MPCPVQDAALFRKALDVHRRCIDQHGSTVKCENAILSHQNHYTWHPHPNNVPYPSDMDVKETTRRGKEYLCIGLPAENKTICFHKSDNFKNPVCKF